jgi:hypothetical protein
MMARQRTGFRVSVLVWSILCLAGYAVTERIAPARADDTADAGRVRIVQPGDNADIRYLCKLPAGEVIAATDRVAEDQLKSAVFLPRDTEGPVSVTAGAPVPDQAPGK